MQHLQRAPLDNKTQRQNRLLLEDIGRSKTPKKRHERGMLPYALIEPHHVEEVRDEKLELTGAIPRKCDIPIINPLREILDASTDIIGLFAYLVTDRGVPFTVKGFGNKFQDWVKADELPSGLAAHGLRKSAATHAAGMGATDRQLMALFGWETEKEANRYTKRANRKK